MPANIPPPVIVSNMRHCTFISVPVPIGAMSPCIAEFSRRVEYADGRVEIVPDGSVTLTPAEFGALPAFPAAYAQLREAVHAKRATFDQPA